MLGLLIWGLGRLLLSPLRVPFNVEFRPLKVALNPFSPT